ncbi:MAG: monovalent cation/H+ antiporter complex subunit F [Hyphomicrobiaceae bacterium]
MTEFTLFMAAVVLGSVAIGLWRVLLGPTRADAMLAAQLLGSGAVAVLLLLSHATGRSHLIDLALVVVLLASVVSVAFVRRLNPVGGHDERG